MATLENDLETTLLVAVGCCLLELDCLKSKLSPSYTRTFAFAVRVVPVPTGADSTPIYE